MSFKDHFSDHSGLYSQYRPDYPTTLFRFLADIAPARTLTWDCATGNGQAARGLAEYFDRVIATDASVNQLKQATPHPRVDYLAAPAERAPFADNSVDLITVAQALHWFELDAFYREVKRVLKPRGILAVWSYGLFKCEPVIDALIDHLYTDIVGPWWPAERIHIENGYCNLPFPFTLETSPDFTMQIEWNLHHLLGYLRTWSAVQLYQKAHGVDPVSLVEQLLYEAWGNPDQSRPILWPLRLRWGRKTR